MGAVANQMSEGSSCQWCGEMIDGEGYPMLCQACQDEHNVDKHGNGGPNGFPGPPSERVFACPVLDCKRKLRTKAGVAQHVRDKHGVG